jgi:hypothetical protein
MENFLWFLGGNVVGALALAFTLCVLVDRAEPDITDGPHEP